MILAEHAQVCDLIVLPEALVDFVAGLRGTVDTSTTRLAIDPVTLEGAAIGPDQTTVATLDVLVVNHR